MTAAPDGARVIVLAQPENIENLTVSTGAASAPPVDFAFWSDLTRLRHAAQSGLQAADALLPDGMPARIAALGDVRAFGVSHALSAAGHALDAAARQLESLTHPAIVAA